MTDVDGEDYLVLLEKQPAQAETLLHSPKQTVKNIGLFVNSDNTQF